MSSCQLDRLPVEMVHHILSYLSAYEIFVSLHHVTSYVDAVLSNYSYYVVNFESVPKLEFDFVCLRTVPNQILSITLSDGWETPGQVKLFLSRFHISQFTRLQSLTLIDVGAGLWEATITKIINLKSLRSFAIIAQHNFKRWYTPMSGANLKALDSNLLDIYRVVLPQLNRLRLPHGDYLKRLHLPNLRYLILSQTSLEVLQHIAQVAPHLRSLKTKFRHGNCSEIIFLFPELKWLSLTIDDARLSIKDMERIISNLPRLKYLQFQSNGYADLCDGHRWQTIATNLLSLDFKFQVSTPPLSSDLDSFRSPFWLEEKRWFVGRSERHLFTVPFFSTTDALSNYQPLISTTSSVETLCDHITSLTIVEPSPDTHCRFNHVHTLIIGPFALPSYLERIVDLTRVRHLVLGYSINSYAIKVPVHVMLNLTELSIDVAVKYFLEEMQFPPMKNIRRLRITETSHQSPNDDYTIRELCTIFPAVQQLQVTYNCSQHHIFTYLDAFTHVLNASFGFTSGLLEMDTIRDGHLKLQSELEQKRLSGELDCTYRFNFSSVHLWLKR